MSKRRKKSRKKSSKKEVSSSPSFSLSDFRIEIVKLLKFPDVRHYVYGRSKEMRLKANEWLKLSDLDKVKVVMKRSDGNRNIVAGRSKPPLYMILKKVNYHVLKKVYNKYVDTGRATKDTCLTELFYVFYGKGTSKEKRKMEKENMVGIDEMFKEDFRFITICENTIPSELVLLIFEFLPRNSRILYTVGRICKHFYLVLLSTWKELRVQRETNVNAISLLVLQNVRKIVINNSFREKSRVPQTKLQYLWQNVSPKNFRELSIIGCTDFVMEGIIRLSNSKKYKDNKTPFPLCNVVEISTPLNGYSGILYLRKKNLSEVFPNLQKLKANLQNIGVLKGCLNLRSLTITWENCDGFIGKGSKSKQIVPFETSKLRRICLILIDISEFNERSKLQSVISCLPNLSTLELSFSSSLYSLRNFHFLFHFGGGEVNNVKTTKFDMTVLNDDKLHQNQQQYTKIEKLVLIDDKKNRRSRRAKCGNYRLWGEDMEDTVNDKPLEHTSEESCKVVYPSNLVFKELHIHSTKGGSGKGEIDFNLEDFLSNGFITSNYGVKNMDFRIPLLSRRIMYDRLFSNPGSPKLNTKVLKKSEKKKILRVIKNGVLKTFDSLLELVGQGEIFSKLESINLEATVRESYFYEEIFSLKFDRVKSCVRRLRMKFECHDVGAHFSSKDEDEEDLIIEIMKRKCMMGLLYDMFMSKTIPMIIGKDDNNNEVFLDVIELEISVERTSNQSRFTQFCDVLYDYVCGLLPQNVKNWKIKRTKSRSSRRCTVFISRID